MINFRKKFEEVKSRVKENPGALYGILYPYILIIGVIIGLYYVANLGSIADQNIPPVIPDTTVVTDLPAMEKRTIPPVDIFKFKEATPELLSKGKELYNSVCASCHNESGMGGGPASVGLNPAPRNFTGPEGWKNGRTLSGIYTSLEEGIEGSAMISYNYLLPEDRIAIAHYIRSEFMTDAPVDSDDELAALDQLYSLSAGVEIPAQIPVSAAKEIIIGETQKSIEKVSKILQLVSKEESKSISELIKFITDDIELAFSALVHSDSWKESENKFISFLTDNVDQNGFNRRIFNLSNDEWKSLYDYLKEIL